MEPFLAHRRGDQPMPMAEPRKPSTRKLAIVWALLATALACALVALLLYRPGDEPELPVDPPPPNLADVPSSAPVSEPLVRHPIVTTPAQTIPPLDASDGALRQALAALVGLDRLDELFVSDRLVGRIVAAVDNLPRRRAPRAMIPVKPPAGAFQTTASARGPTISADNARRYAPYIALARAIDARALVAAYAAFYPLFQRAYEELGFPERYFNDRLVEAIDDLLAAPHVEGPVTLVRPKVYYEFADPDLESLSAGRKVMIRIGPENAAALKQKLVEIRRELTRRDAAISP
jgi:hypothetical protein